MGLYVEVMCDLRIAGTDPKNILRSLCWSDDNSNPQGRSVGEARAEAKRQGWKLTGRQGAVCPGCAIEPAPADVAPSGAAAKERSGRPQDEHLEPPEAPADGMAQTEPKQSLDTGRDGGEA